MAGGGAGIFGGWGVSRRLKTAAANEPVSLAEAKLHCRVDHDDEDLYLQDLITAAREHVEQVVLNRALLTQTWELFLDRFPGEGEIRLPLPPLQSVTGIYYTPDGDVEQMFAAANYAVDTVSEPGRIVLQRDASWPGDTLSVVNGVRIEFVAGYGDAAADAPGPVRRALLLLIGDLYEHREETIAIQGLQLQQLPFGMAPLVRSYRIPPELSAR